MLKHVIMFVAVAGLVLALAPAAQAGLVSHWTFDSDFTDSAGTNHGMAVGDAVVSTADKMIGARSVLLDGSGDCVNVGSNSSLNITGAITLSAWINSDYMIHDDNHGIYTRGAWNDGHSLLTYGPNLKTNNNYMATAVLSIHTWYHVAKTDNGSGSSALYVNGIKVATGGGSAGNKPTYHTRIGAEAYQDNPRWYYEGNIDDVGVWNSDEGADTIALINGLGRTGAIGLDQIDEAQALWAGSLGDTATIGGAPWQKVSGLSGSLGDWGGSVTGVDAYIVLDNSGNGVKVIPEPATMALLLLGLPLVIRRRRKK